MARMYGIIAVTVTPFTEKGAIDYATASKHINWLINSGVHGLLPVGATGEFAAFCLEERKEYAAFVMKEVAGRVPVAIGAVSQNVDITIEVAEHAAAIKADSVMILPPPGLHLNQEEIYEYYKHLSAKISIPIMVYNNPGSSGVDIAPETIERIATLPNMVYLKESTGDMSRMTRMTDTVADKFEVLCGCEKLAYESFMMGAKGWVCVFANVAPAQCVSLYDLVVNKQDFDAARKVYQKMLPMLRLIEDTGELWQVVKYAMKQQGIGNGLLRRPRQPISRETREAVDLVLQATKFF